MASRPTTELPDQVVMPLLDRIVRESLDEDYEVVASGKAARARSRRGRGPGRPRNDQRPPKPAPPADNVDKNQEAPVPAAAAPANNTRVEQGVTFSVDPANVYACEGRDRTTSVVKWDVQRPDVNSVKVLVSDATNPEKKTLAVMSPKGEAKTGEWVIAGLLVELVDGETGKQLATHTVQALPCN